MTPKTYVDNLDFESVNETALVRNDQENYFNDHNLTNINGVTINDDPISDNHVVTNSYVVSLSENDRNGRYLSVVFRNQDTEFDNNNLTNLNSITLIRDSTIDYEVVRKRSVDDSIQNSTIVGFNQILESYLNNTVKGTVFYLKKKQQNTDITISKFPNHGGYLLLQLNIKCIDKNKNGKILKIIKSTKTNSSTTVELQVYLL